jgi:hypothetical protein
MAFTQGSLLFYLQKALLLEFTSYALEGPHFVIGFIEIRGNCLPGRFFCQQKPSALTTVFNVSHVKCLVTINLAGR